MNRVLVPRQIAIACMAIGAVLRVWQYAIDSSLWIDEAALARNIIEHGPRELLGPLTHAQTAPIGFLLVQKALVWIFGPAEYVLRACPLASGLAALPIFWYVAARVLTGWAVVYAVGLFSLGIPFVYFSSQVKPYSSDVAIALALLAGAIEFRRGRPTVARAVVIGAFGALALWFSQPALFVVIGLTITLLIESLVDRDSQDARQLTIVCGLWGISAAAAAWIAIRNVSATDRAYLQWFWGDGFMPFPPRGASDLIWPFWRLTWVFGAFAPGLGWMNGGLNYRWSPIFSAVTLFGYFALWKRQRDAALFLLLPVVVVLGCSALQLYPFTARLLVFVEPFLLLALAFGAARLTSTLSRRLGAVTPILAAILGGSPLFAAAMALPPSRVQHLRPVVERVHDVGGDVYVYYGANLAFRYYADRMGVPDARTTFGLCSLADPRDYLRQLDPLRGRSRVWVVLTHVQRDGERELILGYLDRIGRRVESIVIPSSKGRAIEQADGYLYDLSDPERLRNVSSETAPVSLKPMVGVAVRWGCYGITGS